MAQENIKGLFITFEGSEGSGKSTQSRLLYDYLKKRGYDLVYLREPGGTAISEKIRKILLDCSNGSMASGTEMLLYMSARAQTIFEVIEPALKKGKIVISDRYLDSTVAYQGFGLGMDLDTIKHIGDFVTRGIKPDLTIILDLPVEKGLRRCKVVKDRIEKRPLSYFSRVRDGYLKLAAWEPARIKVIKVDKEMHQTQRKIRELLDNFLEKKLPAYSKLCR